MREDLISRRKILLLAGLATGLAVPAAAVLMASDAEAQQDTSAPPARPGAETAPKKKKQAKAKAKPKAAPSSTAPPSTQPKAQSSSLPRPGARARLRTTEAGPGRAGGAHAQEDTISHGASAPRRMLPK